MLLSRRVDLVLTLVLAACVARLWLMPLPSSFWTDEIATVFIVHYGASHPSLAVAPQLPASIYYWLPRMADAIFGTSEIAYRIPSVIALGLALWLVARIAARLIHPRAGWLAVFACLALRTVNYTADDARPYALGMSVAAAGVWYLIRWFDFGRLRDALLFLLFAALLWRVQLVYWPFYLVFMLYAIVRLSGRDTPVHPLHALSVLAVLTAALAPVAWTALSLFRQARAHVIGPEPDARDLYYSLKFGLVLTLGVGSLVFGLLARRKRPPWPFTGSSLALILGWWLCQPVCIFALSRLTGNSLWVDRYLSLSLPGSALAATAAAALWMPPACWKPAAAILGIAALAMLGQWNQTWPVHNKFDWRTASAKINELSDAPDTPVICLSPFIEATYPVWTPQYRLPGFLYAYLAVYPIHGKPYLLPFQGSPAAEAYARTLVASVLPASRRFFLYGDENNVPFWRQWFEARPELAGWRSRPLLQPGGVVVIVFEAPAVARGKATDDKHRSSVPREQWAKNLLCTDSGTR